MADVVKPARTEYRAPALRVYGDAKKVTETIGQGGLNDGKKNKSR